MARDLNAIARAWEKIYTVEKGGVEYKENFWAFHELTDLVDDHPDLAFLVMQKIWSQCADERVMANLAAGPLEDLLVKHGQEFIAQIEEVARADKSFAALLGYVWKNDISDAIWSRLQAVISR